MNRLMVIVMAGLLACGLSTSHCMAQEEGWDEMIALGMVVSVSPNEVVISEYNYETDTDMDVSYAVTADTVLEGEVSLEDLEAGDSVKIVYKETDGENVAQSIIKEQPMPDEDMMDEEMMGEGMVEEEMPEMHMPAEAGPSEGGY